MTISGTSRRLSRIATAQQVRSMLLTASVAHVLAQSIVILLHESSHTAAGLLLGYQATQFPGQVRFSPERTTAAEVIIALTGPVFSLVTGLLAIVWRPVRGTGFGPILWVWFAFLSAEEGFGYLTIAPLVSAGDTGAALDALRAPGWVGWVLMGVGISGLVLLARCFASEAVRRTRDIHELRAFLVWPWLVGTAVSVLLNLLYLALTSGTSGGDAFTIVMGSASLGVFAPMAMMFWRKATVDVELPRLGVPRAGIVALVVLVGLNALVLTRGVTLG